MNLSAQQRRLIERVINVFETGSADGDYGMIAIFADGPHDIRQITYGRSQTTEYGNLRLLVADYVASSGSFSAALAPYADLVGSTPLTNDSEFKRLLRSAGRQDSVMQRAQDKFFERVYFAPAKRWCETEGFVSALAVLVTYDSFIHSGSMLWSIRSQFAEMTPVNGGDERAWIKAYVTARHAWLKSHRREAVRLSAYRTKDLLREVSRANWDLAIEPITANGTQVRS